jgi:hypothetical protein
VILENDMIRLVLPCGTHINVFVKENPNCGVTDWPPPERLNFMDVMFVRTRMSALTDEQARGMKHVSRAAEYMVEQKEVRDGIPV